MATHGKKPPQRSDRDTAQKVNSHREWQKAKVSEWVAFLRNIWHNNASMASRQVAASYRALTASIRKLAEIVRGSTVCRMLRLTLKFAPSAKLLIRLLAINLRFELLDKIVDHISRLPL